VSTHFWLEELVKIPSGRHRDWVEGEQDIVLSKITQIPSLDEVQNEWAYVNWEEIIKKILSSEREAVSEALVEAVKESEPCEINIYI